MLACGNRMAKHLSTLTAGMLLLGSSVAPAEESAVDFEAQLRPLLEAHCIKCHGAEKQKGGLRLDSPAYLRRGGDSGEPLVLAGRREESHLFKLVSRIDPDEAMPPRTRTASPMRRST